MVERVRNTTDANAECMNRLRGIDALPPGTVVTINGVPTDVRPIVQACLDTAQALFEKRNEVPPALAAARAAHAARMAIEPGLKAWVTAHYGLDSLMADAFGYAPPKKPVRTVASKVQAAEKNRATRKARNTMGKKQKQKIKGVVPSSGNEGGSAA